MAWRADDAATPDRGRAEPRAVIVLGPRTGAQGPTRIAVGRDRDDGPGDPWSPPRRAARDAIRRLAWTAPAGDALARVHAVRVGARGARRDGGGWAIEPAALDAGEGRP